MAINLVAYTWGRQNIGRGDLVVLTEMEHHSNIVPWQLVCQEREAELAYVPVLDDGQLDLEALDALLARRPKLVAVVHVSNVLGTINPIATIVQRAHDAGAVVVVDGTQAVPQMPVDLRDLDADFYAWTGHKAYGPTGIGVLHGRRELLEDDAAVHRRRPHDPHWSTPPNRRGPTCPGSSRPAPRRSPRRSGWARPWTG